MLRFCFARVNNFWTSLERWWLACAARCVSHMYTVESRTIYRHALHRVLCWIEGKHAREFRRRCSRRLEDMNSLIPLETYHPLCPTKYSFLSFSLSQYYYLYIHRLAFSLLTCPFLLLWNYFVNLCYRRSWASSPPCPTVALISFRNFLPLLLLLPQHRLQTE